MISSKLLPGTLTIWHPSLKLLHDVLLKLAIRALKVVVNNDLVMLARLRIGELILGLLQPLEHRLLAVGTAAAKARLKDLDGWRLDENVLSVEVGFLHLFDALFSCVSITVGWSGGRGGANLHLNVEDTRATLGGNILHSLDAGAVALAGEGGVLDERAVLHELSEHFRGAEVVLDAVLLAGAGLAGSVCVASATVFFECGSSWHERAWVEGVRETEKPKASGCAAKRRLRSVDLPVPLGPETTMTGGVEALIRRPRVSSSEGVTRRRRN